MRPLVSPDQPRFFAVVPAAGVGSRLGAAVPKQYLRLGRLSILERSLAALLDAPWISAVLLVVSPEDRQAEGVCASLAARHGARLRIAGVGGATRRDSVLAGLEALADGPDRSPALQDWVLVHDAARPGLEADALERLRARLAEDPVGGLLALPVADTVKRADAQGRVVGTVAREGLWLAQTPQMFRFGLLRDALRRFADVTDEAAAIEAAGHPVQLVAGTRANAKITTAEDLALMQRLLDEPAADHGGSTMAQLRIGQGYDVHALVPGRKLVIGGVEIPYMHGLLGHSDADVLLHAITDALLGAAGLGDIGRHFPDTDARFKGADSLALLRETAARVRAAGFEIGNIDATVVAQAPRLAPHLPAMIRCIAEALDVAERQINLKGKTTERLGFVGRGEGIEAQAVALLTATA